MSTEDVLNNRKTPFTSFPAQRRVLGSRTSFVSVKYFHYVKQNFGVPTNVTNTVFPDSTVFQCQTGVIEDEVASMKVSKSLSQASGTFELHLKPTQNWKTVLSPGDWVAIYIFDKYRQKKSNETDTQNLIMLGNIDRVSRTLQKDENSDKVTLSFVVSGRSSAKALEETDIWFDPYVTQESTLDVALRTAGLEITGNPSTMVKQVLDIFLGPGTQLNSQKTQSLGQWRIPSEVANLFGVDSFALGSSKPSYYDILKRVITPGLPGFKARNMLSPESSGSVWQMVQRSCNELVNEVFVDEIRDQDGNAKPTLVLRPRPLNTPFFLNKNPSGSQFGSEDSAARPSLKGHYQTLQDLGTTSFVEISPAEIIYEDLGKDDHSRMNMFWLRTQQSFEYAYSKVANVKETAIANPTFRRDSIQRYGLKRFDQLLDFCYAQAADGTAVQAPEPDFALFKAFMIQVYDMNYANHLYDVGTITCTGVLEAELGKALVVLNDPSLQGSRKKLFYIEGYDHEWTFPSAWRTTFTVTHGQFSQGDNKDPNIFVDEIGPGDFGAADTTITNAYLNKVRTERK